MAKTNTSLVIPDMPAVPAEVAAFFDAEANVAPKMTVPSLSLTGKVWAISLDGETKKIERKAANGDIEPVSVLRVVILDYAKQRGRNLYEGAYDPDKPGMPICWSTDGVKPHASVKEPKNPTCNGCPMAAKNSKITENGKGTTACAQHRMLAVIPSTPKMDFQPLRLKISITSDYDGQSPDHEANGWFAFSGFLDVLRAKMSDSAHTAKLITKMQFDSNVAYPKILFGFDRWANPTEELPSIMTDIREHKQEISNLLSGTFTPNGADGTEVEGSTIIETAAPKAAAAKGQTTSAKAAADAKAKVDAEAKIAAEAAMAAASAAAAKAKAKADAIAAAKAKAAAAAKAAADELAALEAGEESEPEATEATGEGELLLPGQGDGTAEAAKPVETPKAATEAPKGAKAAGAAPPKTTTAAAPASGLDAAMQKLLGDWPD